MAVIALNALPVHARPVGVGRYVRNLLSGLAKRGSENEYVILVNEQNRRFFERLGPGNVMLEAVTPLTRYRALRLILEEARIPAICRKRGIQIFHGIASMNPWRRLPCRSVITIHDMTYFLFPGLHMATKQVYFRLRLPGAVRRADHVITDSDASRADILRCLNVPREKVTAVPPGIDSSFFRRVEEPQAVDSVLRKYRLERPFILFVGVLEPRKNIPRLLRAYSLFRKRRAGNQKIRLVVAGKKGWKTRALEETLRILDCREDVVLPGYVDDEDLPALYSAAELFAYPSLYEGFGFPVLEAMACGTPVLTSAVSSLGEIAGDAAVLVDPTSEEEIAEGLARGLEAGAREGLASRGLRRAAAYTIENAAEATLAVYRQLAAAL
jgi:glycosyltransferase involved in cell wall biosynthesis